MMPFGALRVGKTIIALARKFFAHHLSNAQKQMGFGGFPELYSGRRGIKILGTHHRVARYLATAP